MNAVKVGIDLGGTKVLIIAGSYEEKYPTGLGFTPSQLEEVIKSFIEKYKLNPVGIAIAIPGLLNKAGDVLFCDVLPSFNGWNANKALANLSTRIRSINDIRAALIHQFSTIDENLTSGIVMVGTAVGAAFIVNGKLLTGDSGWAGEFGYFPLVVDGEIKRIDTLCGGSFLAQKLGISAKEMAGLAIQGDEFVLNAIEKAGYFLGVGIAGLVNLFNPNKLAIGGGTACLPGYWQGIERGAKENIIPALWNEGLLCQAKGGNKVAALGAMTLL
ncbi:ROK family protein [uncultured Cyclobacterium sp.]|uniref:ROK family protein n=1 Tax=uncultured Cyclobacterium sp. TaxID=453820 RepID=UPI0030EC0C6B